MRDIHIRHNIHTKGNETIETVYRDERSLEDDKKWDSYPLYSYFYYNKPITLRKMVKLFKKNKIQLPHRKSTEQYIQDKLTQVYDFDKGNMPLQKYLEKQLLQIKYNKKLEFLIPPWTQGLMINHELSFRLRRFAVEGDQLKMLNLDNPDYFHSYQIIKWDVTLNEFIKTCKLNKVKIAVDLPMTKKTLKSWLLKNNYINYNGEFTDSKFVVNNMKNDWYRYGFGTQIRLTLWGQIELMHNIQNSENPVVLQQGVLLN